MMEVTKARVAYPYMKYTVKVTHSTERKSTAMEWMLLEIAQKAKEYPDWAEIPLERVLDFVFSIADGDPVLRRVLLELQDVGALEQIPGLSDISEWEKLKCGDLKLTANGARLQKDGKLPAKPVSSRCDFIYDVVGNCLLDSQKGMSDTTTSFKVKDMDDVPSFPDSKILDKIEEWKNGGKNGGKNAPPWLQRNSHIDQITPERATVQWKTIGRDIAVDGDGSLSVMGESDPNIAEAILENTDLGAMPDEAIPAISVDALLEKRHVERYEKIEDVIANYAGKADVFVLNPRFANPAKGKRNKICLLLGQSSFGFEDEGNSVVVSLPEVAPEGLMYQDRERSVHAAAISGHFRNFNRQIPYLYEEVSDFSDFLLATVRKYYRKERRIMMLLKSIEDVSYSEFYTPDDLKELFSGQTMQEYTPVDKELAKLLTIISQMKNALGDLSLPVSGETLREVLQPKDGEELKRIRDGIGQWRETLESLKTDRNIDLQEMNWEGMPFGLVLECMGQVANELSVFYDDAAIRYDKVYVFDTCALMDCPDVLDDFADDRALVIIPKQVSVELDGLKNNTDDTKNAKARTAIGKINTYMKKPWMKLDEDRYPELMSKSYQESGIKDIDILSVAVKYKYKKPVMVTNDKNFQNFAASVRVEAISAEELHKNLSMLRGKKKRSAETGRGEKV